ncbi:HEAT repeat domain-containing protein [Anabaena subtropica]|uniref:HEAT repeat domain-containing protein n=1 Tax=Anabaena subtropica FACHB-260 TaxID=2692884 RepID=A0ABR8CKX2_9NOST|nr:HEAT repeat domain-containing protein [Anabaena subtropica]MBD2343629.1 HEAT repeat domain-containing protein [Anabaena subtropica FACHB-260]
MPTSDELLAILERIAEGQHTRDDLVVLRQVLIVSKTDQNVLQIGKYTVNIGQGTNIRIGDNITYQGANAETVQAVLRSLLQEIGIVRQPALQAPLSQEEQKNIVLEFLQVTEENCKYVRLFHTRQQIVLKNQYIPIQVTLEKRETNTLDLESETDLKHIYALKGFSEDSVKTTVSWEDAKKEIRKEAKQKNYKIMVLADPGMGKSTLLRMESGVISRSEKQKLLENQINVEDVVLPIFVRLSDFTEDSSEIINIIPGIIQRDYPHKIADKIKQILKEKLVHGKCILLLDALDEVPNEHRLNLREKLNRFIRDYPCSIISTSRIVGYSGNFIEDAKVVEIVPFSKKQTDEYIETWFANAADYIEDDSISAKGLVAELNRKPQFIGLAQNPLLLSLLCSLYQEKGLTLPARRTQVYEKTVDCMLRQWSRNRKPLSEGEIEAKRQLLEELAYHFSCSDQEVFSSSELFHQIKKYYKGQEDKLITTAMMELTEEYGILQKLDRDGNEYLFLHRTFQEYFTASYLNRAIKENQRNGLALAKRLFWQYDWHETLILLIGLMENPVSLLQTIINEKDDIFQTLLLLSGRCILEIPNIHHPVITNIVDKIYKFWKRYPFIEFIESSVIAIGKSNSQMCCELQKALNDSSIEVTHKAAKVLGQIGNTQAVDALITVLLNDSYSPFRSSAAKALGMIGSPQAVENLIAAVLNDSDRGVKNSAAEALGKIGNPQVVDALITILNDSRVWVRRNAVQALGKIGNTQAVDCLIAAVFNDSSSEVRSSAAEALGEIGNAQAVDCLIALLNNSGFCSSEGGIAAKALGKIGNAQAVDGLIAFLNNSDSYERKNAVEALKMIGNAQAVDGLIAALKNSHSYVRKDAALALGRIGNSQAVDSLIAALNDSDSNVRSSAIWALGKIGNDKAVDCLITILNDSRIWVRSSAAEALGEIGNAQAVDSLIAAFNDSDIKVRVTAAEALGKIGNAQAIDYLIATLHHSDNEVIRQAAGALGNIGNTQALNGLITGINHPDFWVRTRAAEVLAKIGNAQAVEISIAALNDSDDWVRGCAASALEEIGNAQAIDGLITGLNHPDSFVKNTAAKALGKIGNSETLVKIIELPEIDIYDPAIFSLARMLAIRFSKQRLSCIPVYPEKIKYSPIIATTKLLERGIPYSISMLKDQSLAMSQQMKSLRRFSLSIVSSINDLRGR